MEMQGRIRSVSRMLCKSILIGMSAVMLVALASQCGAYLPATDPYVDVYFPTGGGNSQGTDGHSCVGEMRVDTPNYQFTYDVGRAVATSFTIKNTPAGAYQIFNPTGPGCHAFGFYVNNVWYTTNYTVVNKQINVRKCGKYLWEIRIQGITLRSSGGATLPFQITQDFYFWPDKIYAKAYIYSPSAVANIQHAELSNYLTNGAFNRYNNGGGDTDVPTTPYQWMCGAASIPDQLTVFYNGSPGRGSFTQSAVNKTGLDCWCWCVGRDQGGQATTDRLKSDLWIYNNGWHGGTNLTWQAGEGRWISTAYYATTQSNSTAGINETNCDLYPLSGSSFAVSDSTPAGVSFLGFDNTTGWYSVRLPFSRYCVFEGGNPNNLDEFKLHVANDAVSRVIRLQTHRWDSSNPSGYEGYNDGQTSGYFDTLCDAGKYPTGIAVQHSKKWDCTHWPNCQPAYTESYVCLPFAASETADFWQRWVIERWGTKTMVGIPSLDMIDYDPEGSGTYTGDIAGPWLESHIAGSETACVELDDKYFPVVQDFRTFYHSEDPLYCTFYTGTSGIRLTAPNNSYFKRQDAGLRWDSVGPCLGQLSWIEKPYYGETNNANTTATYYLVPSMKNTRVFFKYRTNFTATQNFSNIKRDLRILSVADPNGGDTVPAINPANMIAYLNSGGTVSTGAVDHTTAGWKYTGLALYGTKPWAAAYNSPTDYTHAHYGFIVHSFSGRINGTNIGIGNLCASVYAMTSGRTNLVLAPNSAATRVINGDYVDALVEVFEWDPADGVYSPIQDSRAANVSQPYPTSVSTVYTGTKVSDFPATVAASNNVADFIIAGGMGYNVIRATGFTHKRPVLWKLDGSTWLKVNQEVVGKDYWQADYDAATGRYTFTFAVPAETAGGSRRYRIGVVAVPGDVNGDGKCDITEWNPANAYWNIRTLGSPYTTIGAVGDLPISGDFDGDGKNDPAIYHIGNPGDWLIYQTSTQSRNDINDWGGYDGRIPACGDYDGDGKTNAAEWVPATGEWYATGYMGAMATLGQDGDIPIPGDYDGDGKTDVAVYRIGNPGAWLIIWSSDGQRHDVSGWGGWTGGIPVCGDYNGDGITEVGEWFAATGDWYVPGYQGAMANLGTVGDIPIPNDYDGDGKADVAVYTPSANGTVWKIIWSSDGQRHDVNYGAALGRAPVPAAINSWNGIITTNPVSQTKTTGDSVTFSVLAHGSGLYYQWYHNGVAINRAQSPDYTIGSVAAGDAGAYKCKVTNWNNFDRYSYVATLTVN